VGPEKKKEKKPVKYRKAERPRTALQCRYARIPPAAQGIPPESELEFFDAVVEDINMEGAFLQVEMPLTRGVKIAVELSLPSAWQKVTALAAVRWARPPVEDDLAGMGIQFEQLSAAAYVAIGELITTLTFRE
jgi:hypothetical protein